MLKVWSSLEYLLIGKKVEKEPVFRQNGTISCNESPSSMHH